MSKDDKLSRFRAQAMLLAVGTPAAAAARRLAAAAASPAVSPPGPDGKTPISWFGSGLLIEYYVRC